MPNEWYNKVAGGVANMEDYFDQGHAAGFLSPAHQSMGDYVTFGDAIGRPYDSPTFDAGLVGLGGDATWADSFASIASAIGTLGTKATEAYMGVQQGQLAIDKAEMEMDAYKKKLAEMSVAKDEAAAKPEITGALGQQMQVAYNQAQQQIAQLEQAIQEKKPFYQNPLVLGGVGLGALALWWFLLR